MQIEIDNEEDFYHLIDMYGPVELFHKAFSLEKPYLVITKIGYNTVDYEIRSAVVRVYRKQPLGFLFHFLKQHILEMWLMSVPDENSGTIASPPEVIDALAS